MPYRGRTKRQGHEEQMAPRHALLPALQERDDLRKRRRQERLNELRTGKRKDWVQLHRENPHGG